MAVLSSLAIVQGSAGMTKAILVYVELRMFIPFHEIFN